MDIHIPGLDVGGGWNTGCRIHLGLQNSACSAGGRSEYNKELFQNDEVNYELIKIHTWLCTNKLSLNVKKSKAPGMHIQPTEQQIHVRK